MTRAKLLLAIVCAVAIVSAVAASAASAAPKWLVEAKEITAATSVTVKAETSFDLTSKLTGGATIVILCSKVAATGSNILPTAGELFGGQTDEATKITFSGCANGAGVEGKADEPATCVIPTSISTEPVKTELFDEGTTEVWDSYEPKTAGGTFVTIPVTGCAGEGNYKVTGGTCGKVEGPGAEAKVKLQVFGTDPLPSETSECKLKFGVNSATLAGTAEFERGGQNWTADF